MTIMAGLVIVPLLALLSSLTACDGRGSTARAFADDSSDLPWAPEIPWTEGDGAIRSFFREADPDGERTTAAARAVAALPGYRPERLPGMLHGAGLFRPLRAGVQEVIVRVGYDRARRVYVRVPKGYTPARPWPLVVAYHGSGGDGPPMIARVERLLGAEAGRYVIAAPSHYRQTSLDHPRPVSSEHLAVLHALAGMVHLDSDRVYVTGYSLGGYTAWHLGTLHADRFAGAMPMASTFGFLGGPEGIWTEFFANLRHLPVLSVWGGRDGLDVPGLNARGSAGTMSQVNRHLGALLREHGAPTVIHHEVPRAGHGGARPPKKLLLDLLGRSRASAPAEIEHWFRYVHQAHAYWVEGHAWQGELWEEPWPRAEPRPGEPKDDARWRAIRERLGLIRATHATAGPDGSQRIAVETRHLADLTVWIEEGMIDWDRPVTVTHNGREIFRGRLEPSLAVALAQAHRTRDLDRIRWAGVRVDAEKGTGRVVTAGDDLPPVLREVLP